MITTTYMLIIDDEVGIRNLLTEFFDEEGYQTIGAPDGEAALGFLRSATRLPCVILLDLVMPHLSGHDLLDAMQVDVRLASIPVIVFSATPALHQRLHGHTIATVLAKPFDLDTVLYIVRPYYAECK